MVADANVPGYLKNLPPDPATTDPNKLENLVKLARTLVNQTKRVAELENLLDQAKALKNELAFRLVPEAMSDAGVDRIGLKEYGVDVKVIPFFSGSLPKEPGQRQLAVDWLVQNGHGEIVKSTLEASFGRGEHNIAVATKTALAEYMAGQGLPNIVALNDEIHHMTYKAFIREQVQAGAALPLELLNATVGRIASVEPRKGEGK